MADRAIDTQCSVLTLEEAIALIESGEAEDSIVVDLGGGMLAKADGAYGLQGLLQRLRGYRQIASIVQAESPNIYVPMRPGQLHVHPIVAALLNRLKN